MLRDRVVPMIKASRFLPASSANEPNPSEQRRITPEILAEEEMKEKQQRRLVFGRPGQMSVKVMRGVNLPLISGPVHRFVELEFLGTYTIPCY